MKKETIIDNCQRLLNFFKNKSIDLQIKNSQLNPNGLLDIYSRLLDVSGCNSTGNSILFIPDKDEFMYFQEQAAKLDGFVVANNIKLTADFHKLHPELIDAIIVNPPTFKFERNGYYWTVINK